ncbi:TldD/PmbA family protein [Nocardioides marmoribigeumensis]|uniref:TldD protein n=1 Tax=Nocardioides marmoribigeumensis TaxID=433649 RepID=A0ABU2C0W3_9ACTN|nr:TldD/PmbA family protein [Nocardioides marmoribigeumensis]MDR7364311.1 TldD protein [Nocardioides marmoribigeumensis]
MADAEDLIDPDLLALPRHRLAEAALDRARALGVQHADFRLERNRFQRVSVRDGQVLGVADSVDLGMAVRVVHRGAWGFASGVVLDTVEAERLAAAAVRAAEVASTMTTRAVHLADEPVHADAFWVSSYEVDPFDVPVRDKVGLLADWTRELSADPRVDHAHGSLGMWRDAKFYADLHGTSTTQQRIRVHPEVEVSGSDTRRGLFDTMRTIGPPAGRGWEYLSGTGHDWVADLASLPGLLEDKLHAPTVEAGRHDLVIHPSNLWLTIHESIGHATELDRALGYEASYAGTSFATIDQLGSLRYGSPVMHVTGDRTVEHGLSTIGYDDEGVATQSWDIVRDGVLVGYQLDRSMAAMHPELNPGLEGGRSNGCAYADSPGHVPIQRMANVSLQPAPDGPDVDDLVAQVERGLYVVGDKSWSIDMQRKNFQFTGQRFFRIEDGRLAGQVRDVAYQATTTDFWGSMEAVGGPQTWELGGAVNCGKAQPGQVAPVSHGCPAALFRGVRILNTNDESAH